MFSSPKERTINHPHQPDFEGAKNYVLQRLEHELSPALTYHSIAHTRDQVVPAVVQLATLEGIPDDDKMLLFTAAWFHDLGYIERHTDNEVIAVRIAREVLPSLGYSEPQIQAISDIIMVTRLPQTPRTQPEAIMCDADLAALSSKDFLYYVKALRDELAVFGKVYDDEAWYMYQLEFLQQHEYFTASARQLYNDQKRINIATIERLLATLRSADNS